MFIKPKIRYTTQAIVLLAMLSAIGVICSLTFPIGLTFRVGIFMKFSLAFIVIVLAAIKFGPIGAALVAGISDIIGAYFSPFGITPLITLTAVATGICFGLFLYKKYNLKNIIISVILTQFFGTALNTLWLVKIYDMPLTPIFIYFRILQIVIMIIFEIITLYLLLIKTDILKKIKF